MHVLVATSTTQPNTTGEVRLEPYESGRVNSGPLIKTWYAAGRSPLIARGFIDDLARFADLYPGVLVTAEALSQAFWRVDETFLSGFEELARDHEVRVAYYVRPQHTAIEASWREGGYKRGYEPSEWVFEQSQQMHYLHTLELVRELAPNVSLGLRPFRIDLLDGASPVRDFLRRFLSLDEECADVHENPGLPLELANVLRHAPNGWFWSNGGETETYPRARVREVFAELDIAESPSIRRSRLILQQYCHDLFESENAELIRRLEWPTAGFVPSADGLGDEWEIAELDTLWAPAASDSERSLLYWALRAALAEPKTSARPATRAEHDLSADTSTSRGGV